jgi:hypothetical protein
MKHSKPLSPRIFKLYGAQTNYSRIQELLNARDDSEKLVAGARLVQAVRMEWESYLISLRMIRDILIYFVHAPPQSNVRRANI